MVDSILEQIVSKAKESKATVALGVGSERPDYAPKTVRAATKALQMGVARPLLVGDERILKPYLMGETGLEVKFSNEPERTLVDLLGEGRVDAVVRGSAGAAKTLHYLRECYNPPRILRIGLLEASDGHQFFFAPVGIDEGKNAFEKLEFIRATAILASELGVSLKVAVLSGGRKQDLGRSEVVDKTLTEAEFVVARAKELGIVKNIKHYEILIEDALQDGATFILAPDGISGNIIYRTLIHLGSGRSHGAPLFGIGTVYVDTSRAAPPEEYISAIALASALVGTGWGRLG